MKPVVVLILVIVIGLLAVAAFVFGVTDPLIDVDAATLSKKWQGGGDSFGVRDVDCSDCSANCKKEGAVSTIVLAQDSRCDVRVAASNAKVRAGVIRIDKGKAIVQDLVYRMEEDQEMKMGEFKLWAKCKANPEKCDKERFERDLQFGEQGGRFTIVCKCKDAEVCELVFPAQE